MPSMDPEILRAKAQRAIFRRRMLALRHYGGDPPTCACCQESHYEFLAIDHINGGGKKHQEATNRNFYKWLLREGLPPGYRVLCHNCNMALGFYGYCPHTSPERAAERAAMPLWGKPGLPPVQSAALASPRGGVKKVHPSAST
jgi:hypothetical protein